MPFRINTIRFFVVPTGATTGRRIEIDGVAGTISVYDASDRLRIRLGGASASDADSVQLLSGHADETTPSRIRSSSGSRLSLSLSSPERINQADRAWIDLESPVADPGLDRAQISIYNDGSNADSQPGVDLVLLVGRLFIFDGTDRPVGRTTLVAGTRTVNNASIDANTLIFLSRETAGGTLGHLSTTRVAGTSFTINSSSATDTSTVAYLLIQPL